MQTGKALVTCIASAIAAAAGCGGETTGSLPASDTIGTTAEGLSTTATVSELQPSIAYGGRAVAGSVSGANASNAVVAAETGGLFMTANGGASWSHVAGLTQFRMADAKIDPRDAQTVIATTHDDDHATNQGGIWRSTDGGTTWARVSLTVSCSARYNGNGVGFAPDRDDVFVGTSCGVAVSHDKGATWTHVDMFEDVGSVVAQAGGIVDVFGFGGNHRSTDAGASFGPPGTGSPKQTSGQAVNMLAVSPINGNVLFAATHFTTQTGTLASLFESDDGGASWRQLSAPGALGRPPSVATRNVGGQTKVYFSNGPNVYRHTCTGTSPAGSCTAADLSAPWERLSLDHADVSAVVFGPTGTCPAFITGDAGVLRTSDPNCASFTTVPGGSTGYGALQVYDVVAQVHPDHSDLYLATQDNGLWASGDNGATWPNAMFGDARFPQVVHDTPNNTDPGDFVTFKLGAPFHNGRSTALFGQSLGWIDPPMANPGTPFVVSQNVYVEWATPSNGTNVLFVTTNASSSWTQVPGGTLTGSIAPQTWVAGPASAPTIYQPVTRSDGRLGLVKITGVLTSSATITRIDGTFGELGSYCDFGLFCPNAVMGVDPNNAAHLIVADSGTGQMKTSTDGGNTWTVDSALTSAVTSGGQLFSISGFGTEARVISVNPGNGQQIALGTASNGVIASGTGGSSWFQVSNSRQVTNITSFAWDEVRRNIYAASYGRGLFKITDNDVPDGGGASCIPQVASGSVVTQNGSTGVPGPSFSYTVPAVQNALLLVHFDDGSGGTPPTAVTYGGQSMTLLDTTADANSGNQQIWYLVGPASGAHTLAFTTSGNNVPFNLEVETFQGVKQGLPIGSVSTAYNASYSTQYTTSLTTRHTDGLMADFVSFGSGDNPTVTLGNGQTESYYLAAPPSDALSSILPVSVPTTYSQSYTFQWPEVYSSISLEVVSWCN